MRVSETQLAAAVDGLGDVAIVHEWVAKYAGSEQVFEHLARLFPDASLYALTNEPSVQLDLNGRSVNTTIADRVGTVRNRRAALLPLMPLLWKSIATESDHDVIISSSHAFSRYFPAPAARAHLCYCHAPMRYAWTPELDNRGVPDHATTRLARRVLRRADLASVPRVTSFAANSNEVRDRIRTFYNRDAVVIPPPVDTQFFAKPAHAEGGEYVLAASRWVPYKRLDLAIDAAAAAGIPIVVAGGGSDERRLRNHAAAVYPAGVTFEPSPSNVRLRELMHNARAFIFPAHEDFGIIPLEAQAAGTPVLALGSGGSLDTVCHGRTGIHVGEQTATAFADGLRELLEADFSPEACRTWAETFSPEAFAARITRWIDDVVPKQ